MRLEFLNYLNLNYTKYLKRTIFEVTNASPLMCYIHAELLNEFVELVSFDTKFGLEQLLDIFAVDYPFKKKRFEINYIFLNIKSIIRLVFKVALFKDFPIFSLTKYFKSANWLEREVWDMFGIFFFEHPDLRRILTDYGFDGYPLRKDFPITGFKEVRYDDERKKIVLEPIRMTQEFRYFDFTTPWIC